MFPPRMVPRDPQVSNRRSSMITSAVEVLNASRLPTERDMIGGFTPPAAGGALEQATRDATASRDALPALPEQHDQRPPFGTRQPSYLDGNDGISFGSSTESLEPKVTFGASITKKSRRLMKRALSSGRLDQPSSGTLRKKLSKATFRSETISKGEKQCVAESGPFSHSSASFQTYNSALSPDSRASYRSSDSLSGDGVPASLARRLQRQQGAMLSVFSDHADYPVNSADVTSTAAGLEGGVPPTPNPELHQTASSNSSQVAPKTPIREHFKNFMSAKVAKSLTPAARGSQSDSDPTSPFQSSFSSSYKSLNLPERHDGSEEAEPQSPAGATPHKKRSRFFAGGGGEMLCPTVFVPSKQAAKPPTPKQPVSPESMQSTETLPATAYVPPTPTRSAPLRPTQSNDSLSGATKASTRFAQCDGTETDLDQSVSVTGKDPRPSSVSDRRPSHNKIPTTTLQQGSTMASTVSVRDFAAEAIRRRPSWVGERSPISPVLEASSEDSRSMSPVSDLDITETSHEEDHHLDIKPQPLNIRKFTPQPCTSPGHDGQSAELVSEDSRGSLHASAPRDNTESIGLGIDLAPSSFATPSEDIKAAGPHNETQTVLGAIRGVERADERKTSQLPRAVRPDPQQQFWTSIVDKVCAVPTDSDRRSILFTHSKAKDEASTSSADTPRPGIVSSSFTESTQVNEESPKCPPNSAQSKGKQKMTETGSPSVNEDTLLMRRLKGTGTTKDQLTLDLTPSLSFDEELMSPSQNMPMHKVFSGSPLIWPLSCSNKNSPRVEPSPHGSVIYDPKTGKLGVEDQQRSKEIKDIFSVHPAFRRGSAAGGEMKKEEKSVGAGIDIDEVIGSWQESSSSQRTQSAQRSSPLASRSMPTTPRAASSAIPKPSRQSGLPRVPLTVLIPPGSVKEQGSPASLTRVRTVSSPHQPSPLSNVSTPAPGYETSNLRAWKTRLGSEEMNEFRKKHKLPPLQTRITLAETARRHPHHPYLWNTIKLYCRTEHEGQCTICSANCCLYAQQRFRIDNNLTSLTAGGRNAAEATLADLRHCGGQGIEGFSVFLHCSECERKICPLCAGRCSEVLCEDVVCKHCSSDPWSMCSSHSPARVRKAVAAFEAGVGPSSSGKV